MFLNLHLEDVKAIIEKNAPKKKTTKKEDDC